MLKLGRIGSTSMAGMRKGGILITCTYVFLVFVDDLYILANTLAEGQMMVDELVHVLSEIGFSLKVTKTKRMCVIAIRKP